MFEWQAEADVTCSANGFIVLMLLRVDNLFKSSNEFFNWKFGVDPSFKFGIYAFDTIGSENFDKLFIDILVENFKIQGPLIEIIALNQNVF